MVRRYALFAVALGFLSGAVLRSEIVFGYAPMGYCLLVACIALLARRLTQAGAYGLLALFMLAGACGALRVGSLPQELPPAFLEDLGKEASFSGAVAGDPDLRETSQRVPVRVSRGSESALLLAVLPLYPELRYGETVRIEGTLTKPEAFWADGGRVFRYDRYLEKDGIFGVLERARVEIVAPPQGMLARFLNLLYGAKRLTIAGIERALPEPESALAAGLLVGGKQGLGNELADAFTRAGLVHIVVLSGYNVMIVALFLMAAFSFLPKRAARLAGVLSIGAFVLAAGAGAASVRAGAMAALGLLARGTGRSYDALRALALVAFLMVLWHPLSLAYDPGFQFSLAATLGLILFADFVAARLCIVPFAPLREIAATTIAAQIGVLPILLYQTGMLSPYALASNLIALPVVPLAMLLSFVAAAAGILVPVAAPVLGAPAYFVLAFLISVAEFISNLPYAGSVVPAFPFALAALAYGALFYVAHRLRRQAKGGSFRGRNS